jgi:hypothetical protein
MGTFILGTLYIFSDGASITANVIGASGGSAELTATIGLFMIIGSIGLFIVSMHNTDHRSIDLERLIRRTKDHHDLTAESQSEQETETRYNTKNKK